MTNSPKIRERKISFFRPKTDVWDFQSFSQTFLELRLSLGDEGKDSKNLNSQTWPGTPRRPSPRHRERKISPKFFHGRPRGMSVPKCLFSQDLEGLTEVFGRMSAGISGQKLPLWAEFSFLKDSDQLLA